VGGEVSLGSPDELVLANDKAAICEQQQWPLPMLTIINGRKHRTSGKCRFFAWLDNSEFLVGQCMSFNGVHRSHCSFSIRSDRLGWYRAALSLYSGQNPWTAFSICTASAASDPVPLTAAARPLARILGLAHRGMGAASSSNASSAVAATSALSGRVLNVTVRARAALELAAGGHR